MRGVEVVQQDVPDVASRFEEKGAAATVREVHAFEDSHCGGHSEARVTDGDERDCSWVQEEGVGDEGEVRVREVAWVGRGGEESVEVGEDGGRRDGEERVGVDEEGVVVLKGIVVISLDVRLQKRETWRWDNRRTHNFSLVKLLLPKPNFFLDLILVLVALILLHAFGIVVPQQPGDLLAPAG